MRVETASSSSAGLQESPGERARREAQLRSWQEKRGWRISRIHSPEAQAKRSSAFAESRDIRREKMMVRAREQRALRMEKLLGEDWREELNKMYCVEELSFREIGERLGKRVSEGLLVRVIREDLGIEKRDRKGKSERQRKSFLLPKIEFLVSAYTSGEFEKLNERERRVLSRYFRGDFPTQKEVAGEIRVSRQTVASVERNAFRKLGLL